jgi:hypothetical protein
MKSKPAAPARGRKKTAPARPRSPRKRVMLRPGDLCPSCQQERLDYDGLLNLSCPRCGVISGGCFT